MAFALAKPSFGTTSRLRGHSLFGRFDGADRVKPGGASAGFCWGAGLVTDFGATRRPGWRLRCGAFALATVAMSLGFGAPAGLAQTPFGQVGNPNELHFPLRNRPPASPPVPANSAMLVQADEIKYDYSNNTVAAVGHVQIYYGGATIEADKVVYDQKTKRLRAEGNARLTEANGRITYGQIINLTDDYRDGFVELASSRSARRHAFCRRARRSRAGQLHGAAKRRLYRLRTLSGQPEQAAGMAGQGRAHHSFRQREDDLFRRCDGRFVWIAGGVFPVHVDPGHDGKAQERFSLSDAGLQHSLRIQHYDPLLFQPGARLRSDHLPEIHDQTGLDVECGLGAKADQRLLWHQGLRNFPAGSRLFFFRCMAPVRQRRRKPFAES